MRFDEIIDRRGTHCAKWDLMEQIYGVPTNDGIAMWVADMDFRPPRAAYEALGKMMDMGVIGYYGDDREYLASICWWMENRHGWKIDPDWIFTAHGLVNGTAICVDAFSSPGDGVVLFTPVYHSFARVISAADRQVVECSLINRDGLYQFDFSRYDALMTGNEKIAILCSPHNPGGRVWTREELAALSRFCQRHDLVLVSDEIHHDLVFSGHRHIPMSIAAPELVNRLVVMTAITKTFNLAGAHIGNVIIEDPILRARFGKRINALGISPNSFGSFLVEAVYSPESIGWLEQLMIYIDGNRRIFDEAMHGIPGAHSMDLEATYLAWVDFRGTGLSDKQLTEKICQEARIAANFGPTFGLGGEGFMRFNLATPRTLVEEAASRIREALLK